MLGHHSINQTRQYVKVYDNPILFNQQFGNNNF